MTVEAVKAESARASLRSRAKAFGRYDVRITIRSEESGKLRAFRMNMTLAFEQALEDAQSG